MKIICDACSAKYSIADEKVAGKVFKIRCKKCSNIIVVRGKSVSEQPSQEQQQHYDQKEHRTYGYSDEGPADSDDAVWYLVIAQDQVGPLTVADVRERFAQGEVDRDTYIWREGFADWSPLGTVDPFTDLDQAAPQGGVNEAGAAEFGGLPDNDASATMQSDPADLFGDAGGDDAATELFGGPPPGAADGLFGGNGSAASASSAGGIEMSAEAERKLRGERNENSVLFSLNNLAALASDSPKPTAPTTSSSPPSPSSGGTGSGGEGSGLIDIRSMAQVYLDQPESSAAGPVTAGQDAAVPAFGQSAFGTSAPMLLPTQPSDGSNNKTLYVMLGIISALVVAATVLVILVIRGGGEPEKPPVVVDRSTASAPSDSAAPAPTNPTTTTANPTATTQPPPSANNPPVTAAGAAAATTAKAPPPTANRSQPKSPPRRQSSSTSRRSSARKPARAEDKPAKQTDPPPARPREPEKKPSRSGGCLDEVGCLLADKPPPCCSKYTGGGGSSSSSRKRPTVDRNLPETLNKSDIKGGMARIRNKVVACGNRHKGKGQVKLSIKVAPSGSVSSVDVKSAPNSSLGSCVASAVQKAKFPKSQKGRKFSYPFVF